MTEMAQGKRGCDGYFSCVARGQKPDILAQRRAGLPQSPCRETNVVATTALARSASFTRLVPSLIAIFGYAGAFWLLSVPLRVLPTGVVYALWSGLGIVLITAVAWVWQKQVLDTAALLGL
eukprot:gene10127-12421_t